MITFALGWLAISVLAGFVVSYLIFGWRGNE